jgi:hypothetical protein
VLQSLDISGQIPKKACVNPNPVPREADSQLRRQESLQVKRRETPRQVYLQLWSFIRNGLFENFQCVNELHYNSGMHSQEEFSGPQTPDS